MLFFHVIQCFIYLCLDSEEVAKKEVCDGIDQLWQAKKLLLYRDDFARCFCFATIAKIRLGIQILYGLKQLHEIGYVHRDVNLENLYCGFNGKLDFLLCDFKLFRT